MPASRLCVCQGLKLLDGRIVICSHNKLRWLDDGLSLHDKYISLYAAGYIMFSGIQH